MFEHVDGTAHCKQLFKHFTLPDGTQKHVYVPGKKLMDEEDVKPEPAPAAPFTLAECGQDGWPARRDAFQRLVELKVTHKAGDAPLPNDGAGMSERGPRLVRLTPFKCTPDLPATCTAVSSWL